MGDACKTIVRDLGKDGEAWTRWYDPQEHVHLWFGEFTGDLWTFSRTAHVWLADTPRNVELVKAVWAREPGTVSTSTGVTTFRSEDPPVVNRWLATIAEHHPDWTVIQIWGSPWSHLDAWDVARALGVRSVDVSADPNGFQIWRTTP